MNPVPLELRDICKTYRQGDAVIHALRDVNLTIEPGDFVSITGQSGSGKSTLMNILGCLDIPTSGSYLIGGQDTSNMPPHRLSSLRSHTIGFIFQNFCLIPDLSALENVELPLLYQGIPRKERREMAQTALERVGLSENNPWKWCRISHGVTYEDFFWIRFEDEDIQWKDVRVRC